MTEDQCHLVDIDGQTIRLHGSQPMTDHEQDLLTEIVRAAKRKYAAEHPAPGTPVFPQTDTPGHPQSVSSLTRSQPVTSVDRPDRR